MPNTYSQIYIQIVFCVSGRLNLIAAQHKEELHKYITGIVTNRGAKLIAIHCMPDHTHLFIGLRPSILLSDLVRDIKAGSSKFINDNKWVKGKFGWQERFGAFSYSHSHIGNVVNYINSQEEHHKRQSFKEEYLEFLRKFEVEYKDEYLFNFDLD